MTVRNGYRLLASLGLTMFSLVAVLAAPAAAITDTKPPTMPTGLRAAETSFTWVDFDWNASTDNSGSVYYYWFEIQDTGWNFAVMNGTTTGNLGGLEPGRSYQAIVRAVDRAGNSSARVSINFTTLARTGPAPTKPTNLHAVFVDGKLDSIAWSPSTHDSFVYYEIFSGGVNLTTTASTSVTILELWNAGVIDVGPNFFTVRAWGEHEYGSELSDGLALTITNPNR